MYRSLGQYLVTTLSSNGITIDQLIRVEGNGVLDVVAGGVIETDSLFGAAAAIRAESGTVRVSGGTIETINLSRAIVADTVIITDGTVISNGGAITINALTVTISGGTVKGLNVSVDDFFPGLIGGTVKVTGGSVMGEIRADSVTVTGGTIEGTIAINARIVNVSGGTITGTTSMGMGGQAIAVVARQTGLITGGTVSSVDEAIRASGAGVVAYLKGHVIGDSGTSFGMVIEVDTLSIPASRHGTSEGLDIMAGGNSVEWNTAGEEPVIVFTLQMGGGGSLAWGSHADGGAPPGGGTPPSTPPATPPSGGGDSDSGDGCNAGIGFGALALVTALWAIRRR